MHKRRKVSILGSTGSIGTQTLEVIERSTDKFEIAFLTANRNIEELAGQTRKFNPIGVVIRDEELIPKFKEISGFQGEILTGDEGLCQAAAFDDNDLVISSLVGFSGVIPTLAAISSGCNVALANKETLVSAGHVITNAAKKHGVNIIAVDSEHNAILQCLAGEKLDQVEKLILTASGGPFRQTDPSEFENITVAQALDHPNWSMGNKITIDSATLMNKGFEVIEAYWLFGVESDQIDVVVHPQSIIHSMVLFVDGSFKAQLGLPDMRVPISYALNFPERHFYDFPRMDISQIGTLSFEKPDYRKSPCLKLAFDSLKTGHTAPAVLNAANEIAVHNFLEGNIKFTQIPELIDSTLQKMNIINNPSLEDVIETDQIARKKATEFIKKTSA